MKHFSRQSEFAVASSSSLVMKETLNDLQNLVATSENDFASLTANTFLVDTAFHTTLLTVPPIPSTAPLPREIAKKYH